jgi:hypothetical protein
MHDHVRFGEFFIRTTEVNSDPFATFVRGRGKTGKIFGFYECSVLKGFCFVAQLLFVRLHAFIL